MKRPLQLTLRVASCRPLVTDHCQLITAFALLAGRAAILRLLSSRTLRRGRRQVLFSNRTSDSEYAVSAPQRRSTGGAGENSPRLQPWVRQRRVPSPGGATKRSPRKLLFRPSGAWCFRTRIPTAEAVGCFLPPLRGFPARQEAGLRQARQPVATKSCHPPGTGVKTPAMSRSSQLTFGQRVSPKKHC